MKIRKYRQTIDEWGREIAPNGIARAAIMRFRLFPEEVKRNLVFTNKKTGQNYDTSVSGRICADVSNDWIYVDLTDTFRVEVELREDKNPGMMLFVRSKIQELQQAVGRSDIEPVLIPSFWRDGRSDPRVWFFKQDIYIAESSQRDTRYTADQIKLLILEFYDRERRRFEKLKHLYDSDETGEPSNHRERIPERVRIEVWRRDGGKCARCGSREKLEYDHIVPVSRGGSNTARNIELLCETCNRKKSNNIE